MNRTLCQGSFHAVCFVQREHLAGIVPKTINMNLGGHNHSLGPMMNIAFM